MTAPTPFPRNLWSKELGVPHWTLHLQWSAEIVRTKRGWKAKAAMKPFLALNSHSTFQTKEDAISSVKRLFEGFWINPWESESPSSKCSTTIHQCLELVKTQDHTWVLYSVVDSDYGYEFDSKEEAQELAEAEWVHRFVKEPE